MVNMDDDAPSGEAMLRALYERMASAPSPASVSSARLPSLTELAALMPERLSLARLQAIRRLSAQQRMVIVPRSGGHGFISLSAPLARG